MEPQFSLEPGWRVAFRHLEGKERSLADACRADEDRYAGLVNFENRLRLIQTRLAICLVLMDALAGTEDRVLHRKLLLSASRRARDALGELEDLRSIDVSEEQRGLITEHPEYTGAVHLLEQLILEGGGILLEPVAHSRAKEKKVRDALVRAIAKYAEPDDHYGSGRPCGIDQDEEGIVVSDRIRLPLSQAVLYIRSELLPELDRRLEEDPDDPTIRPRIHGLRLQLDQLRRMRSFPLCPPPGPQEGFQSQALAGYSPQGEPLVTVMCPILSRSGTTVSRTRELTIAELVRRLAGRGVCRKLDEYYEELRGIESGTRGSSGFASIRLDVERGFSALKRDFPHLRALESGDELRKLMDLAAKGGRHALESGVRCLESARPPGALETAFLAE